MTSDNHVARRLVVAIHDVAPATLPECRALRETVAHVLGTAPVSLLVVPCYHGERYWSPSARSWVGRCADEGDEIVLHGLEHRDYRGFDGAEFPRSMPAPVARRRLLDALTAIERVGLTPHGFVAPAYLHPSTLDAGCAAAGLDWWATRVELRTPGGVMRLPSVGLGASTPLRRALSPTAAWVGARALRFADAVRIDLHPADLRDRRLRAAVRPLLLTLSRQGREPACHRDLLDAPVGAVRGARAAGPGPASRGPAPVSSRGRM